MNDLQKKLRSEYVNSDGTNPTTYQDWLESKIAELRASLTLTDAQVATLGAERDAAIGEAGRLQFALWGARDRAEEAESANAVLRSQIATLEALANDAERVALRRDLARVEAERDNFRATIDHDAEVERDITRTSIQRAMGAVANSDMTFAHVVLKLALARLDGIALPVSNDGETTVYPTPDCSAIFNAAGLTPNAATGRAATETSDDPSAGGMWDEHMRCGH